MLREMAAPAPGRGLAAGRRAKIGATHDGAFIWADSTAADFNSGAADRFHVRASGGVYFYTATQGAARESRAVVFVR